MKDISAWALNVAEQRGASYVDARIADDRSRALSTKNGKVGARRTPSRSALAFVSLPTALGDSPASDDLSRSAVEATAARAVDIAMASSRVKRRDIQLAPQEPVTAEWSTPFQIDPFYDFRRTKY